MPWIFGERVEEEGFNFNWLSFNWKPLTARPRHFQVSVGIAAASHRDNASVFYFFYFYFLCCEAWLKSPFLSLVEGDTVLIIRPLLVFHSICSPSPPLKWLVWCDSETRASSVLFQLTCEKKHWICHQSPLSPLDPVCPPEHTVPQATP